MIVTDPDPAVQAAIRSAAAWHGLSVEDYACQVVARASAMDVELAAFVQEGIDSADRGELIDQADMEEWFEARYRPAAAE